MDCIVAVDKQQLCLSAALCTTNSKLKLKEDLLIISIKGQFIKRLRVWMEPKILYPENRDE